jgi:PAS domain-containing protein
MNHVDQSQLEILDSLSDSILVADREGLVVALNQAARLIFHLPAADQIGRPLGAVQNMPWAGARLPRAASGDSRYF